MSTCVVLCMIVRDESAVLARCLDSVLPVVDAACLCDTGSVDGTPELAEALLSATDLPYEVHRHEWVDFGANRTRAFTAARDHATGLGWDLDRSYALFIDADVVLRVSDGFDRDCLTADSYHVTQENGPLRYDTLLLARLSLDWSCRGGAHEYWAAKGAGESPRLDCLSLLHFADGGSRSSNLARETALLERDLASNDVARTIFYLARSYEDGGRFAEARRLYDVRAAAGGWDEEAWYAAYRSGLCSLALGEWERAIGELLGAWGRRPGRAEPLYRLAHTARMRGSHDLAVMLAERARRIPWPESDRLFIEAPAYGEGPLEEISISAFYTAERGLGAAACEALLHRRDTSPGIRDLAGSNVSHYAEQLEVARTVPVEVPAGLRLPGYTMGNAAIQPFEDGYLVVNRLHTYDQTGGIWYVSREPDGRIRSRNVALRLDPDLALVSGATIDDGLVDRLAPLEVDPHGVHGLEDLRLVRWDDVWWFTAGSWAFGPHGHPSVVLGRLDQSGTCVEHLAPLDYAGRAPDEKNWLPFLHDGRLLLLYACDPTVILEPDLDSGECREVLRAIPPVDLTRYRGSAPPFPFGDGYLFVTHEVTYVDGRRVYLHRFVEMDRDLAVRRASHPFWFWRRGVEYCCGACLDHDGEHVLLAASRDDRESWVLSVARERVQRMLVPLDVLAAGAPDRCAD
ncbi:MAG TPA: glycosyltransferase [Thermomicrobiaceae bacterium]|nr:glycosyltransferase [Thermomicrobiaceae bacterium]